MKRPVIAVVLISAVLLGGTGAAPAFASAPHFKNCTAMHKDYPHGVARKGAHDKVRGTSKPVTDFKVSTSIYDANKKLDRDKDGVACEEH